MTSKVKFPNCPSIPPAEVELDSMAVCVISSVWGDRLPNSGWSIGRLKECATSDEIHIAKMNDQYRELIMLDGDERSLSLVTLGMRKCFQIQNFEPWQLSECELAANKYLKALTSQPQVRQVKTNQSKQKFFFFIDSPMRHQLRRLFCYFQLFWNKRRKELRRQETISSVKWSRYQATLQSFRRALCLPSQELNVMLRLFDWVYIVAWTQRRLDIPAQTSLYG